MKRNWTYCILIIITSILLLGLNKLSDFRNKNILYICVLPVLLFWYRYLSIPSAVSERSSELCLPDLIRLPKADLHMDKKNLLDVPAYKASPYQLITNTIYS